MSLRITDSVVNNLLAVIIGNSSLAMMDLAITSPARKNLEKIEKAAEQAANLTKQMLAFSGRGKFIVTAMNFSDLVDKMTPLLNASISKKACASS